MAANTVLIEAPKNPLIPAKVRPYAKAVLPLVLALVAAALQWAITGEFDTSEIATALTGIATSGVTFGTSNGEPVDYIDAREPTEDETETTLGTPTSDLSE
jgi:hypothetical protein